ncbi:MAG: PTS fructose transporter subunit IIA [Pseudomonadota bacterium]
MTHTHIGETLLRVASDMLGRCPLPVGILSVSNSCDVDRVCTEARTLAQSLDQGAGLLILTDLYGSTPSNIAHCLMQEGVRVVSGINLPMLVRVFNYPALNLEALAVKAQSGAIDGIRICAPGTS